MLCSRSTLLMSHTWNKLLNFNGTGARMKFFYFSNDLTIPPCRVNFSLQVLWSYLTHIAIIFSSQNYSANLPWIHKQFCKHQSYINPANLLLAESNGWCYLQLSPQCSENSLPKRGQSWRKQNPTPILRRQLCYFNITIVIKVISLEPFCLQIFNSVMKSKEIPLPSMINVTKSFCDSNTTNKRKKYPPNMYFEFCLQFLNCFWFQQLSGSLGSIMGFSFKSLKISASPWLDQGIETPVLCNESNWCLHKSLLVLLGVSTSTL